MQNKRGIRQNGVIHSQNQMRRELNAEGLVLTRMYYKYKSCTGNDNVRGVRTVPVAWLRVECVSLKGITIIVSEQGIGENERWNLREMEYASEGAEAIEADRKRRQVAAKESVLQPKLLFHFWMSSGTWEATNKATEFSFLTDLVCETVFILLLSLVKWFWPLSLVIFPTASHTHTHVSTERPSASYWDAGLLFQSRPLIRPFILPQGSCSKPALLRRPEKV